MDDHAIGRAEVLFPPIVDWLDAIFIAPELGHDAVLEVAVRRDAGELRRPLHFEGAFACAFSDGQADGQGSGTA